MALNQGHGHRNEDVHKLYALHKATAVPSLSLNIVRDITFMVQVREGQDHRTEQILYRPSVGLSSQQN